MLGVFGYGRDVRRFLRGLVAGYGDGLLLLKRERFPVLLVCVLVSSTVQVEGRFSRGLEIREWLAVMGLGATCRWTGVLARSV